MLGSLHRLLRSKSALAGALYALAGCGGDAASSEQRLMLRAEDGPFTGTLAMDAPHVGQHRVVLSLSEDAEGSAPVEGATVKLSPWMPAHGHGSIDAEALEEAPGVYVADDVWLNMPGVWDLRVRVVAGEQAAEHGELTATVEVP